MKERELYRYGADAELDARVVELINRTVLANQSYLMKELMERNPDLLDDIENQYPDPAGWTPADCKGFLDDNGYDYDEDLEALTEDMDDADDREADAWREAVRDAAEPPEIYEWWLVDQYGAEELAAIGQPILSAHGCTWWGRTCTGQAIKLDPTFYEILYRIDQRAEARVYAP